MKIKALVIRILLQFLHDKRTLALMLVAPVIILTLLSLVFNGKDYKPIIGTVNPPKQTVKKVEQGIRFKNLNLHQAATQLANGSIDGYIFFKNQSLEIVLEGSDPILNRSILQNLSVQLHSMKQNLPLKVSYLHGSKNMGSFDYFGPVFIGFFAFFFVFLIAGVSFLRERTKGTLERLMVSPLQRWEIVAGYVLGFGIFTTLQSLIIALYSIYILNLYNMGSILYILLTTLLLSLTALTLGTLLSAYAQNELQMFQFIPVVVVPQVFFSGLFNLETMSDWLSWICYITPLYYGGDALRNIMIRGYGWDHISKDIIVLLAFSVTFMAANILALRKYRKV